MASTVARRLPISAGLLCLLGGLLLSMPSPIGDVIVAHALAQSAPLADLSVVKAGPATYPRGYAAVYNVVVANNGDIPAQNVVLTDTIAGGTTFVSSIGAACAAGADGNVRCVLGTLAPRSQTAVNITLSFPASLACGSTVSDFASVTSDTPDPDGSNNRTPTVQTQVTCGNTGNPGDLAIIKQGPTQVIQGKDLLYNILVANNGITDVHDVTVTDTFSLPASDTFRSATPAICAVQGAVVVCNVGTLHALEQKAINIVFSVNQCALSVTNVATISSPTPETNLADNTSQTVVTSVQCAQPRPQCSDGIDNDYDGLIDAADPGCHFDLNPGNPASYEPSWNDESRHIVGQCSDGIDNDGDTLIDSQDPDCHTDGNPANPGSYDGRRNEVSSSSSSSSAPSQTGCIDVVKETYDTLGNIFTPVPQFSFHLDGQVTKMNDGSGRLRFDNVTPGIHLVTEDVPASWTQVAVTPQGGTVNVVAGSQCAAVSIKNRQVLPDVTSPHSTFNPNGSSNVQLPPRASGFEDDVRMNSGNYPVFPDADPASAEGQAANLLFRRGIVGGFPDGTFRGSRGVNRAEAAKFLLLASGTAVPEGANNGEFWDVLDGEWYVKYVVEASRRHVIAAYPDGSFGPDKPVNSVEFLKMLALTFKLPLNLPHGYADVPADAWFAPYAGIAHRYDLFPDRGGNALDPSRPLTRGEVAVAIARIILGNP